LEQWHRMEVRRQRPDLFDLLRGADEEVLGLPVQASDCPHDVAGVGPNTELRHATDVDGDLHGHDLITPSAVKPNDFPVFPQAREGCFDSFRKVRRALRPAPWCDGRRTAETTPPVPEPAAESCPIPTHRSDAVGPPRSNARSGAFLLLSFRESSGQGFRCGYRSALRVDWYRMGWRFCSP